jgi:hypothetical protein
MARIHKRQVNHMQTIEAYYDGRAFVPIKPVAIRTNERAIVTILDGTVAKHPKRENDKGYLAYAGTLSDEKFTEITEILKDVGQIDADEW